MKHLITKSGAAALALCALTQSQMAMAQSCISEEDLSSAVRYSMPAIVSAVSGECSAELPADGFFATQSNAFLAPYVAQQDANWPGTLRVIKSFGSNDESPIDTAMFDALPESALRPFVDAIITTMLAKEIKPDQCGKIERGMELIAPLPPENIGGLIGFVVSMVEDGRAKEGKTRMLCTDSAAE